MPADVVAKTAFCLSSSLSCHQYQPLCTSAWNCREISQHEKMRLAGRVPLDGEDYARFQYTSTRRSTGEKTECNYKVRLVTTPCHFGGVRWWFLCPLITNGVSCGRRVGTLYCPPGATYYGCRHCYNLTYESRNKRRLTRLGDIGYPLVLEGKYEDLYERTKRWTYRGRPTKKARRLHALEARLNRAFERFQPEQLLTK